MTGHQTQAIAATRWTTPFADADQLGLHLLRVDYGCGSWISFPDGRSLDLSEFAPHDSDRIWIYSSSDETVYCVENDGGVVSVLRDHDFPQIYEWGDGTPCRTLRLKGTALHLSASGLCGQHEASYFIATEGHCIEFLSLNEPQICAVARPSILPQNNWR